MSLRPRGVPVGVPVPPPAAPAAPGSDRLAAVLAVGVKTGVRNARVAPSQTEAMEAERDRAIRERDSIAGELDACRASEVELRAAHELSQDQYTAMRLQLTALIDAKQAQIERGVAGAAEAKADYEDMLQLLQDNVHRMDADYKALESKYGSVEESHAAVLAALNQTQRELEDLKAGDEERADELLDVKLALAKAFNALDASRAEYARVEAEKDIAIANEKAVRELYAAMQARIEALEAQVQSERQSARGQDELDALKAELKDMRKGMGAANPQEYADELRSAVSKLNVEQVRRLLDYGANIFFNKVTVSSGEGLAEVAMESLWQPRRNPGLWSVEKAIKIIDHLLDHGVTGIDSKNGSVFGLFYYEAFVGFFFDSYDEDIKKSAAQYPEKSPHPELMLYAIKTGFVSGFTAPYFANMLGTSSGQGLDNSSDLKREGWSGEITAERMETVVIPILDRFVEVLGSAGPFAEQTKYTYLNPQLRGRFTEDRVRAIELFLAWRRRNASS